MTTLVYLSNFIMLFSLSALITMQLSFFLIVYIIINLSGSIFAQTVSMETNFSSLSSSITQIIQSDSEVDTVKGKFYFSAPNKIFLQIDYPLSQIMIIDGNITTIYYPKSEKAFELTSQNNVLLPVIPGLTGALKPDYGLSQFGFNITAQTFVSDTLVSTWHHPESGNKAGSFTLKHHDDLLQSALYQAHDGFTTIETKYKQYKSVDSFIFPAVMQTKNITLKTSRAETVLLDDFKVNSKFPEDILNFQVPEHVHIEKRKW